MDRAALLLKLFDVYEKIRKDQEEHLKNAPHKPPFDHKKSQHSHSVRHLLMAIHKDDKLNQRTLASKMHISSQAVSELVKKLSQEGLVEKISGAQNNENYIVLTEKGLSIAKHLEERIEGHANALLGGLTEEEVDTMYGILDKIFEGKKDS